MDPKDTHAVAHGSARDALCRLSVLFLFFLSLSLRLRQLLRSRERVAKSSCALAPRGGSAERARAGAREREREREEKMRVRGGGERKNGKKKKTHCSTSSSLSLLLLRLLFFTLLSRSSPTPTMSFLAQALGSRPSTGDIEFWHGAERSGWLMKQGEKYMLRGQSIDALSFRRFLALWLTFFPSLFVLSPSQSLDRRVYQDVEAPVSD